MKKLFAIVVIFTAITNCKPTQSISNKNKPELEQQKLVMTEQFIETNKWELVRYKGQVPSKVGFERKTPVLVINKAENRIGGNSGCNSFGGEVIISDNTIRVDKVISTKMYCDGVPENEFFQMLQQSLQFKVKDNVLKLLKDDSVILEFKNITKMN